MVTTLDRFQFKGLLVFCVFILSLTLYAKSALACGTWTLADIEKGQDVVFYAITVQLKKPGTSNSTIMSIRGDDPESYSVLRGSWAQHKKPVLSIKAAQIFTQNQIVGTFSGNTLKLNDIEYQIVIENNQNPACNESCKKLHPHSVKILKNAQQIAYGDATSFYFGCGEENDTGKPNTSESDIQKSRLKDILYRVGLYLAWRDILDDAPQAENQSRMNADQVIIPLKNVPSNIRESIQEVIHEHIGQVWECNELAPSEDNLCANIIEMGWFIDPTGVVQKVHIEKTTLNNDRIATCLIEIIKKWKFKPHSMKNSIEVSFPFHFRCAGE